MDFNSRGHDGLIRSRLDAALTGTIGPLLPGREVVLFDPDDGTECNGVVFALNGDFIYFEWRTEQLDRP